jgi:hypothetical protein
MRGNQMVACQPQKTAADENFRGAEALLQFDREILVAPDPDLSGLMLVYVGCPHSQG